MEKSANERIAVMENRLDIHDQRLKAHDEILDALKLQNKAQDAKLDQICRETQENSSVTHSIKGGVDTVKWLLAGVSTIGGLWLTVKQLGWF